jgi:hypothetical protein
METRFQRANGDFEAMNTSTNENASMVTYICGQVGENDKRFFAGDFFCADEDFVFDRFKLDRVQL